MDSRKKDKKWYAALIIGILLVYPVVNIILWLAGTPAAFFEYTVKEDGTIAIDNYDGYFFLVNIPDTIDGMTVSEISDGCFSVAKYRMYQTTYFRTKKWEEQERYELRYKIILAVHIPDSVERIGDQVFENCTSLRYINMPANLRNVGVAVLAYTKVSSLVFPEGIEQIGIDDTQDGGGEGSFMHMSSLRKVVFPSTLKVIGKRVFTHDEKLREITLPDGIERIGLWGFLECGLETINLPDSLEIIDADAFTGTPYEYVFQEEHRQGDFIIYKDTLYKYIGEDDADKDVVIPDGVKKIGSLAFEYKELRSVYIPDGVSEIGLSAFYYCSCTNVRMPDSLTFIDEGAFADCRSLKEITIPGSVEKISADSFSSCESLERLSISNGVKEISGAAFIECTSLKSVVIPESVTVLGDGAFYDCTGLENVEIKGTINSIGKDVFRG
ncbi:MAG: leucine-rich repeat domain-containing protein [Ruminococcus sp.]|nr:leucine-rich repeat domain-containing protein [Ruminococcus sp.]